MCRSDAVEPPHAYVHQHQVGTVGRHGRYDLVAVIALGDDLETVVRSQDSGGPGAHDWLIVDDNYPNHGRDCSWPAAASGSRASTRHPSAVGPASRSPPSARARSRMPISPKCAWSWSWAAGARPWSATTSRTSPASESRSTTKSTRLEGAWRATFANASRPMRCRAVPTGPSMPAVGVAISVVTSSPARRYSPISPTRSAEPGRAGSVPRSLIRNDPTVNRI